MLGTTTVFTLVVVILASSDWITPTPTCCFWVLTIVASDAIGGVVLTEIDNVLVCGYTLVSSVV